MSNLFAGLVTSKTRIKILIRLFLNDESSSYLRELAKEFNVSSNAVREELNQLMSARLLKSCKNGRQVYYTANQNHPLFNELKSMVRKVMGIDQVIEGIINRLGDVQSAYLIDDYAEGKDSGIIDLLLVGNIDRYHLDDLSRKTERYINRTIRTIVLTPAELRPFFEKFESRPHLLIWQAGSVPDKPENNKDQ